METSDLTRAINEADLPAIVAEYYPASGARPGRGGSIKAEWRGDQEASGSLYRSVVDRAWLVKDHATGEAYNAYHFLTQVVGLSEREAAEQLGAEKGQMPRPASSHRPPPPKEPIVQPSPNTPLDKAIALAHKALFDKTEGLPKALEGRGFLEEDQKRYFIAADGDDAIFPILNPEGRAIGLKRRKAEGSPRYAYEVSGYGSPAWCSPGFLAARNVLVVEGELNAMIGHALWHQSSWGFMGVAGANGHLHLDALKGKKVWVYADGDEPGAKARERWAQEALSAGATRVVKLDPWEQDFCDLAGESRALLQEAFEETLTANERELTVLDRLVSGYRVADLREDAKRYMSGEIPRPMGFFELDHEMGGLTDEGVVGICALPSMGKSALLRDILLYRCEAGKEHVMLFTPDQSPKAVFRLLTNVIAGVSIKAIRRKDFKPAWLEAYGSEDGVRRHWGEVYDWVLTDLSQRFEVSGVSEMKEMQPMIEAALDRGVTLFGGDYMQLFEPEDSRGHEHDGRSAKIFKKWSRNYQTTFLMAIQLAKSKFPPDRKDGRPTANDIEGSGRIYQSLDQCLMLYNWAIYHSKYGGDELEVDAVQEAGRTRIIVSKNKEDWADYFRYLQWCPADGPTFRNLTDTRSKGRVGA